MVGRLKLRSGKEAGRNGVGGAEPVILLGYNCTLAISFWSDEG